MHVKYSILIPSCGGKHLQKSLRSVFNAKRGDYSVEVILVLDKPDINAQDILATLKESQRMLIKVIQNPENMGITRSLNIGLKEASGTYICRLDDDDLFGDMRFLEIDRLLAQQKPPPKVITGAALVKTDTGSPYLLSPPDSPEKIKQALQRRNILVHPALNIEKETLVTLGGYNESYRYAQDYDLSLKLLENNIPIYSSPEIFVERYEQKNSITVSKRTQQALFSLATLCLYHANHWDRENSSKTPIFVAFMRFATPPIIRRIIRAIRSQRKKVAF